MWHWGSDEWSTKWLHHVNQVTPRWCVIHEESTCWTGGLDVSTMWSLCVLHLESMYRPSGSNVSATWSPLINNTSSRCWDGAGMSSSTLRWHVNYAIFTITIPKETVPHLNQPVQWTMLRFKEGKERSSFISNQSLKYNHTIRSAEKI